MVEVKRWRWICSSTVPPEAEAKHCKVSPLYLKRIVVQPRSRKTAGIVVRRQRLQKTPATVLFNRRRTKWTFSTLPAIKHYKVSFRLKRNLKPAVLSMQTATDKLGSSFGVVRSHPFTYTVYFPGFVNCCGSKSLADITLGFQRFRDIAGLQLPLHRQWEEENIPIVVDNITASGKLALDVRLTEIVHAVSELGYREPEVCFRPRHYNAIHVRFAKENWLGEPEVYGGGGLLTLYHTGSYTIVGVKNEDRLNFVYQKTVEMLRQIHGMLGRTLL